jgi:hypothetical protein
MRESEAGRPVPGVAANSVAGRQAADEDNRFLEGPSERAAYRPRLCAVPVPRHAWKTTIKASRTIKEWAGGLGSNIPCRPAISLVGQDFF